MLKNIQSQHDWQGLGERVPQGMQWEEEVKMKGRQSRGHFGSVFPLQMLWK